MDLRKQLFLLLLFTSMLYAQQGAKKQEAYFEPTLESSRPWVYWYWMQSAYSRQGITADLEAMKRAGIGGAYLMTIKGPANPPLIDPPVLQLSKEFWQLVHWALSEADRLGVKIAFHPADGFAVAGGPWITPDISMQKVVWKDSVVSGNSFKNLKLAKPKHYKNYYQDIAIFAIPLKEAMLSSAQVQPKITSSLAAVDAGFLSDSQKDDQFRLKEKGWIQYEFDQPFLCKSLQIETKGNNYQAHRMLVEVSDDGKNFRSLGRLRTPRHGWQDVDAFYTHSIPATKAKYFRFVYDPQGSEPGAEDLDPAKWNQGLKVAKIYLSNQALIENYQGKSGAIWRLSPQLSEKEISPADCIDRSKMINISDFVDANGLLNWKAPAKGKWRIIRFGHTSTGHENATGGAGKGLEVDKFNKEAIRLQLDHWFGEMLRTAGPELASKVVEILHMDSWECGSQNWSPVFREEFRKRRAYDIVDYLPLMAGIPLDNIQQSEQVLYDVRKTISELVAENFFGTLKQIAQESQVKFSSENVAPTMMSDGLLHFKYVDYPSGEFWLKSPTHDKPNDMLDAISGGHIYGKDIIQAEAFTALKMDWNEQPGNLKTLADWNYALGINRFFYHVFVHNPWLDRKPGMTLDGIGSFFQRDQTWWDSGRSFFDYCQRVQLQLQKGKPVVDLAVFIGEDLPSRSVLPDRLLPFIPNVFGKERVQSEALRLQNEGEPSLRMPKEVSSSKNSTDLSKWINAMNGYHYDSFNADVLIHRAKVENGKVSFGGGIEYGALLFPGSHKMAPNGMLSIAAAEKILQLVKEGATVFLAEKPSLIPGLHDSNSKLRWEKLIDELWGNHKNNSWNIGKGKLVRLPFEHNNFESIGISQDLYFPNLSRAESGTLAWTHRRSAAEDIYFISNQKQEKRSLEASFRVAGKKPYWYNPVSDSSSAIANWKIENGRTLLDIVLEPNESGFVLFKEQSPAPRSKVAAVPGFETVQTLDENWELRFDSAFKGPKEPQKISKLLSWSQSENEQIKYYSGTAVYTKQFVYKGKDSAAIFLDLGEIADIAQVSLNGVDCGTVWTFPYRIAVSKALKKGYNTIEIKITNTWANRLIGDQKLPKEQRLSWTNAAFRLEGEELLKAGLLGPLRLVKETQQ